MDSLLLTIQVVFPLGLIINTTSAHIFGARTFSCILEYFTWIESQKWGCWDLWPMLGGWDQKAFPKCG